MRDLRGYGSRLCLVGIVTLLHGCDLFFETPPVDRPQCEAQCTLLQSCEEGAEGIAEERPPDEGVEGVVETRPADKEREASPNPCVEDCVEHSAEVFLDESWPTIDHAYECVEAIRATRECINNLTSCEALAATMKWYFATELSPSLEGSIVACYSEIYEEGIACQCLSHAVLCEGEEIPVLWGTAEDPDDGADALETGDEADAEAAADVEDTQDSS